VGLVKTVGRGRVLVFGAALAANTLGDLDIVHQMALKMGCLPLFNLSDWADVRLSQGDKGSFLFINNYQDDPIETTIECENETLFGGHPVKLPARRGVILPLEWRLNENVTIRSLTTEITEIVDDGTTLLLKTEPADFFAELSLKGFTCDQATLVQEIAGSRRVTVQGKDGMILLRKDTIS
jgi:beta-galactosidase